MHHVIDFVERGDAPSNRPTERLDVRDLPPPQPLQRTLEELSAFETPTILLQINDRLPQHLFPMLRDRGYRYESYEHEDSVVTVIWEP